MTEAAAHVEHRLDPAQVQGLGRELGDVRAHGLHRRPEGGGIGRAALGGRLTPDPALEALAPAFVHVVYVSQEGRHVRRTGLKVGRQLRGEAVAVRRGLHDPQGVQGAQQLARGQRIQPQALGDLLARAGLLRQQAQHPGAVGHGDHAVFGETPAQGLQVVEVDHLQLLACMTT